VGDLLLWAREPAQKRSGWTSNGELSPEWNTESGMYADVGPLLGTDAVLRDGELALEDMESKKASGAH